MKMRKLLGFWSRHGDVIFPVLEWVPAAASVNVEGEEDGGAVDEFGAKDFRSQMLMRDDHEVSLLIWRSYLLRLTVM